MCWTDPAEPYNGGRAFKCTCRTAEGVILTVIADNYFGYCKKEVKTQISYSANLFGLAEEEHAGGALQVGDPHANHALARPLARRGQVPRGEGRVVAEIAVGQQGGRLTIDQGRFGLELLVARLAQAQQQHPRRAAVAGAETGGRSR